MKMGTPMAMSIAMQTSRIFFNPVLKPRTIDEALHKKYYSDFFHFVNNCILATNAFMHIEILR